VFSFGATVLAEAPSCLFKLDFSFRFRVEPP